MRILYLPNQYSQQRQFDKKVWVYPILMAMEAQYNWLKGHDVDWVTRHGVYYDKIITKPEGIPFLKLPYPDRVWTNAFDKKYQSYGNYKYHPATHIQVANGCWWGKCKFCVEQMKPYEVRPVGHVILELWECQQLGFKEVFDDSGTFPIGSWLDEFCYSEIPPGIKLGCNMRITNEVDFNMMKRAGFRILLFGIESANQNTLDRLRKGVRADDIIPVIKRASEAGLEPHIAVMFGYPWETCEEEERTLHLVHYMLRKGYAKTAQASLYRVEGERNIERNFRKRIYEVAYHPQFWYHQIKDIKSFNDFKYLLRKIKAGLWR